MPANKLIVTKQFLNKDKEEVEEALSVWIRWIVLVDYSVPKLSTSKINECMWILDATNFDYVESFEGASGLNGTYKLQF